MWSPEERENTLRRSLSQSDGDSYKMADGLDPNAEVQQRAMQRYHKLLQTDKQLQVRFPSQMFALSLMPSLILPVKVPDVTAYVIPG